MRWQFVLGADLSSRLVAWYGQGYGGWSHVDAVLSDGSLLGARSDTIKDIAPGVRIRPPNYEPWTRAMVLTLKATPREDAAWESYLHSQIGHGYDKADIWGFILGKPLESPGHWICSALQLNALQVIGRLHKLCITPQQCPPNMFSVILSTLGAKPS